MADKFAVTVIVPMYNVEKYIEPCLRSLLEQTTQDFEVIVVDDCSTDRSLSIVKGLSAEFNGRLTLLKMKKNNGAPGLPRNLALKSARGRYVSFLDSDDLLTPTALEELISIADSTDADVLHSEQFYAFDEESDELRLNSWEVGNHVKRPTHETNDIGRRIDGFCNRQFYKWFWLWSDYTLLYTSGSSVEPVVTTAINLSPQELDKDYISIDRRSKLGVQCNTNNGVLTSYGAYSAVTSSDDDNNYIVVGNGTTDVHAYRDTLRYSYNTGYTGSIDAAKTMEVNIGTSAHGMYVHPETLRGSDNFYSGTLYLEFPARIPDGVQCYYATALDDNEDLVGLTEVTGTIPANTAVIVKAPSEYKFFAFNESDETPDAPTDNIIQGTIEGLSVTPGTVLTLGHNVDRSTGEYDKFGFWNYRGSKISPFRAYIPKANLTAGAKSGFSLVFPEDNTTGIARLTYGDATENGTWYTLSGVRLNGKPTGKGIYVNNGKKIVIR